MSLEEAGELVDLRGSPCREVGHGMAQSRGSSAIRPATKSTLLLRRPGMEKLLGVIDSGRRLE